MVYSCGSGITAGTDSFHASAFIIHQPELTMCPSNLHKCKILPVDMWTYWGGRNNKRLFSYFYDILKWNNKYRILISRSQRHNKDFILNLGRKSIRKIEQLFSLTPVMYKLKSAQLRYIFLLHSEIPTWVFLLFFFLLWFLFNLCCNTI